MWSPKQFNNCYLFVGAVLALIFNSTPFALIVVGLGAKWWAEGDL